MTCASFLTFARLVVGRFVLATRWLLFVFSSFLSNRLLKIRLSPVAVKLWSVSARSAFVDIDF